MGEHTMENEIWHEDQLGAVESVLVWSINGLLIDVLWKK